MNNRDFYLVAIDILSILTTLFLIALLAVRYDSDKGLGESDYLKLPPIPTRSVDIVGSHKSNKYIAIIINSNNIELLQVDSSQATLLSSHTNPDSLILEIAAHDQLPIVLYEAEQTHLFGEIIRKLASKGFPVGIARVSF